MMPNDNVKPNEPEMTVIRNLVPVTSAPGLHLCNCIVRINY